MTIHRITIIDSRPRKLWHRRVWAVAYPVMLIGIGALLGSSAMQWLGFLVVIITVIIWIQRSPTEDMTIGQAREYLAKLEAQ